MNAAERHKPHAVTCDRRLICDFLRALFPEDLDEPNSFGWGGLNYANWSEVNGDSFQLLSGDIAFLARDEDVYFHVCTHDPKKVGETGRGNKKSPLLLPAVYLDLDVHEKPNRKPQQNYAPRVEAEKFLFKDGCPLKPSIVIESGSGGFHVYWLLKEPIKYDEQLVKRWQESCRYWLGFDIDLLHGAAQIMRIPGTINHTYSTLVDVRHFGDSLRYDPSDFDDYPISVPKTSSLKTSTCLKYNPSLRYTKGIKSCDDTEETILEKGELVKLIHSPEVMLPLVKQVLKIDIKDGDFEKKGDYKKFCCILPGHEESNPSASLLWGENDALIYQDFHDRDNKRSYSLTVVYASQHYKSVKTEMSPTEKATWLIRMLIEGDIIPPANVQAMPLPKNASKNARRVYEGFGLLMQCRGHYSPNTPAAFAWNFAQAWCQIPSRETLGEGLRWLKENGYMVKAGEHPGHGRPMNLYELGSSENVIKTKSKAP